MKNRVLILVENLSVPFDRRVWLEARAMREAGFVVSIICPRFKNENPFEIIEGVNIHRYSSPPSTKSVLSFVLEFSYCLIMSFVLSLWVFFRYGFDYIHACNPPDTFFVIGLFYKVFGVKFVFDQHDLCPEVYLAKFGEDRKDLLYRALLLLEYLTYKTADRVIATNKSYEAIAVSRGRVSPDRAFIVRTGPDLSRLKKTEPDNGLKLDKRFLVLYLGVMAPQDGVDYFLLAIDIIINKFKRNDILFSLIGSGDSIEDLKKLKYILGLDGSVIFTGRVSDEKLVKYLSTSDVCIAPDPKNALNDKSTMNKILEYMAMAKPIVCFDLKEARYSAGPSALYAEPNNVQDFAARIIELLDNEGLRKNMGAAGYERLKGELSWAYNKKRLIDVYS
ncbi:MAG: glycosyltransferase WbuB [Candidatus Omnitrophica bacterium CG02_land_8_20_14_3_00__42_8]|nr:MAG: glycosyltransferase WbuB [Candidatus Omnitrophica bacterium CG02_land_8_20_14_3_00__42_8]PIW67258.1 MAG: glycosyltransferase WbuB [Candidatus Omnitrophica bacterium CG12_big_fil_rev_8_21_14_0_65_42_8]